MPDRGFGFWLAFLELTAEVDLQAALERDRDCEDDEDFNSGFACLVVGMVMVLVVTAEEKELLGALAAVAGL